MASVVTSLAGDCRRSWSPGTEWSNGRPDGLEISAGGFTIGRRPQPNVPHALPHETVSVFMSQVGRAVTAEKQFTVIDPHRER